MRDLTFEDIERAFHHHVDGSKKFTRRIAINMADMLNMDVWHLIRTLESQGLLKDGAESWFKVNGGFTPEHFEEARNDR